MRKGRLGRGLEALLGDGVVDRGSYRLVPVESLRPKEDQPRLNAEEGIEELVESVKRHGVLQPILVVEREGTYLIVAGERRWLAAKRAGLKEVPVVVGDWSDRDIAILAIVENVQRKDLNPIEEAVYYKRLSEEYGYTQEEMAALTGKSRAHIANIMRILKLPDEVISALKDGRITLGHAKALLSLEDESSILEAFREVVSKGLSVRQTEELVRSMRSRNRDQRVFFLKPYNLKVKIIHGRKTSKAVIQGKREDLEKFLSSLES